VASFILMLLINVLQRWNSTRHLAV